MREDGKGVLGDWDATGNEVRDALEVAVQNALREHKRAGRSVVVWDREKDEIVVLKPEEIDVPDEPAGTDPHPNGAGPHQTPASSQVR